MSQRSDQIDARAQSDVRLSRFNPLRRIFFYDDFDFGANGWCELIGNHDGDLNNVRPVMADLRPPQLSNLTFWDIGTHGAMTGRYALKVQTRSRADHMSQLIKRTTMTHRGLVQFETYFTFKAEQRVEQIAQSAFRDRHPSGDRTPWDGNVDPSEADFGEFTFSNDMCIGSGPEERAHCALRYVNADPQGKPVRAWFYKTSVQPSTKMVRSGQIEDPVDYHVCHPDDWLAVPGSEMALCYNELPTKVNWHYLRWCFDTRELNNTELQVNDVVLDLRSIPVPRYAHGYQGLKNLLNFCVDVRTCRNVRNALFLDSVLVSVDW